jgi:lipopolysaccharide transport system ATP-binding protein
MEDAIIFENVSKRFRIYHEKRNSVFEHLANILNRNSHYEQLPVLDNISFSVKKGEMFGIIGRNGVGKTTLLRLIAGILKPDKGTIRTNGSVIPLLELGTGFHPDLTAKDNIVMYGIILGLTRKVIEESVDYVLKFAELESFADTKIKNFSSGMYARLAFSTAMQIDPDIVLIDEILAVGDLSFQQKSFDALMSFRKRGKTIVYVSQTMEPIRELCDKAVLLSEGKIASMGSPDEVSAAYLNLLDGCR